jgi:hypothetical protein
MLTPRIEADSIIKQAREVSDARSFLPFIIMCRPGARIDRGKLGIFPERWESSMVAPGMNRYIHQREDGFIWINKLSKTPHHWSTIFLSEIYIHNHETTAIILI